MIIQWTLYYCMIQLLFTFFSRKLYISPVIKQGNLSVMNLYIPVHLLACDFLNPRSQTKHLMCVRFSLPLSIAKWASPLALVWKFSFFFFFFKFSFLKAITSGISKLCHDFPLSQYHFHPVWAQEECLH